MGMPCLLLQSWEKVQRSQTALFLESLSLKLTKTAAIFFSVARSDASEFPLAPRLT